MTDHLQQTFATHLELRLNVVENDPGKQIDLSLIPESKPGL